MQYVACRMSNGYDFLFAKEAAASLRVTYQHFMRVLRSGKGPPFTRVSRTVRIPADDFHTWSRNSGRRVRTRKG